MPEGANIILGTRHFKALVDTVPRMKFGIAFNEASGAFLTRNRTAIPSTPRGRIKDVPEVYAIHFATANPVEVRWEFPA